MNANLRACIAYAAGRGISGRDFSGVYDYFQSKRITMSGSITPEHIDAYDEAQHRHFSGDGNGARYSLYYDGDPESITLEIRNNSFRGCDHGTSFHFSGRVQPASVNLYDCENGLSFRFGI